MSFTVSTEGEKSVLSLPYPKQVQCMQNHGLCFFGGVFNVE